MVLGLGFIDCASCVRICVYGSYSSDWLGISGHTLALRILRVARVLRVFRKGVHTLTSYIEQIRITQGLLHNITRK